MNFKMFNNFKTLLLAGAMLVGVVSCADYDDDITSLNDRIDALTESTVTIDDLATQLDAIEATIPDVTTLTENVATLMEEIEQIDVLDSSISALAASVATDLAALETKMQSYVDGEITSVEESVAALYATIESLNEVDARLAIVEAYVTGLPSEFTTITEAITALRSEMDALDGTIASWTGSDLTDYISGQGYMTEDQVLALGYVTTDDVLDLISGLLDESSVRAIVESYGYTSLEAVSLVGYLTSDDIADFITEDALTGFLTSADLVGYLTADDIADFVTGDDLATAVAVYSDYVSTSALETALAAYSDYVSTSALETALEEYLKTANAITTADLADFLTSDDLEGYLVAEDIKDFITASSLEGLIDEDALATYLSDNTYTTSTEVSKLISDYFEANKVDLTPYATTEALEALEGKLAGYATISSLDSYVLTSTLDGYATTLALEDYVTKAGFADELSEYIDVEAFATMLTEYLVADDLDGYLTSADLTDYVTTTTLSSYVTTSYLYNYMGRNDDLFDDIYETQDEFAADITALYADAKELQIDLTALETKVSDLETYIKKMANQIYTLEQSVAGLESDVAGLESDVLAGTSRIEALEGYVQSMVYVPAYLDEFDVITFGSVYCYTFEDATEAYMSTAMDGLDIKFRMTPASLLDAITAENYDSYLSIVEEKIGLTRATSADDAVFELVGFEALTDGEFTVTVAKKDGAIVDPEYAYAIALYINVNGAEYEGEEATEYYQGTSYLTDYIGLEIESASITMEELSYAASAADAEAGSFVAASEDMSIKYTDTNIYSFIEDLDLYYTADEGETWVALSTLCDWEDVLTPAFTEVEAEVQTGCNYAISGVSLKQWITTPSAALIDESSYVTVGFTLTSGKAVDTFGGDATATVNYLVDGIDVITETLGIDEAAEGSNYLARRLVWAFDADPDAQIDFDHVVEIDYLVDGVENLSAENFNRLFSDDIDVYDVLTESSIPCVEYFMYPVDGDITDDVIDGSSLIISYLDATSSSVDNDGDPMSVRVQIDGDVDDIPESGQYYIDVVYTMTDNTTITLRTMIEVVGAPEIEYVENPTLTLDIDDFSTPYVLGQSSYIFTVSETLADLVDQVYAQISNIEELAAAYGADYEDIIKAEIEATFTLTFAYDGMTTDWTAGGDELTVTLGDKISIGLTYGPDFKAATTAFGTTTSVTESVTVIITGPEANWERVYAFFNDDNEAQAITELDMTTGAEIFRVIDKTMDLHVLTTDAAGYEIYYAITGDVGTSNITIDPSGTSYTLVWGDYTELSVEVTAYLTYDGNVIATDVFTVTIEDPIGDAITGTTAYTIDANNTEEKTEYLAMGLSLLEAVTPDTYDFFDNGALNTALDTAFGNTGVLTFSTEDTLPDYLVFDEATGTVSYTKQQMVLQKSQTFTFTVTYANGFVDGISTTVTVTLLGADAE